MQRVTLSLCIAFALSLPGVVAGQQVAGTLPLQLELELASDDVLLEQQPFDADPAEGPTHQSNGSLTDRAGHGYQVQAVMPSLCEQNLPGGAFVAEAYERAMECEDDTVGVSISIRNY